MKSEKHIEFETLVLPLMRWLRENHHPHVTDEQRGWNKATDYIIDLLKKHCGDFL